MDRSIFPSKIRFKKNSLIYELKQEEELRIYEIQDFIRLRLIEGQAEIFGKELPIMETQFFYKGENLAIFTYRGAKIQVEDPQNIVYEDSKGCYGQQNTQMRELVNLNHILEQMRNQALETLTAGPRVLITGNPHSGKSTISKILVNYCVKLGWTPIYVDLDLVQNQLSAPGCMSASLIESPIDGQTDNLTFKTITYFHGACSPGNFIITPDLFDKQIDQLANACNLKSENDIKNFKLQNHLNEQINQKSEQDKFEQNQHQNITSKSVKPIFPQLFASGLFIDSFSTTTEKETNSVVKAIKSFNADLVIVLDDKRIESKIKSEIDEWNQKKVQDYQNQLEQMRQQNKSGQKIQIEMPKETLVYFMQKHQGVTSNSIDEYSKFCKFQDYFRGKNHQLLQKQDQIKLKIKMIKEDIEQQIIEERDSGRNINTPIIVPPDEDIFLLDFKRSLNEFQVQDIRISLDDYKIYEVKCIEIPITALPFGAKYPRYDTEFDKINQYSPNINNQMLGYKKRIAGVMQPKDLREFQEIEAQIQSNKNDMSLKQNYEECLKKCVCIELIQIKDFYQSQSIDEMDNKILCASNQNIQKHLEVRTIRSNQSSQMLASNIIFISKIELNKIV